MAREHATAKAVEGWAERFGRLLPNSFFGILHCVQDDCKNMQWQIARNCCAVGGSESADAFLWLFELSRIKLERKKECLCDSGIVRLRF